jgi:MFS family permease
MPKSKQDQRTAGRPVTVHGRLLAAIWLAAFLVSFDYTALNVALPTLAAGFDVGTSQVSWIALAYMLVMVALTLVTGPVIDRFGYLRALTWALAVFAAASLASALASTFWLLVALRAVQGIGASVMMVIGPALIKTWLPDQEQDRAFAVFSTGPTMGLCAGPAIGGQLTSMFGWQSVFLFSLTVAVLALALLRTARRQTSGAHPQGQHRDGGMPNPVVAAMASAGVLMLLLAFNQGEEWGWSSPDIVALFLASGGVLFIVALIERTATVPLIDRQILRSRNFSAASAGFFALLLVFGGSVFLMPFYFEWLRKLDTKSVGHLLMIQPIATIVVSNLVGFCFAGTSRRVLCIAGSAMFFAGVAVFASMDRHASLLVPITALVLMGAGAGLFYPTLIQVSMASIPNHLAASASSLQTAVRVLAQLFGVALFETIFSQLYPSALHVDQAAAAAGASLDAMQSAFHTVFWCGAAIAALALLPAFLLSSAAATPTPLTAPADTEGAE